MFIPVLGDNDAEPIIIGHKCPKNVCVHPDKKEQSDTHLNPFAQTPHGNQVIPYLKC